MFEEQSLVTLLISLKKRVTNEETSFLSAFQVFEKLYLERV